MGHTVNLTPAGSGSTKILLISYETIESILEIVSEVVYSHHREYN